MTQSVKAMVGHAIAASDGRLGRVEEVLFDDREWRVCYLVVDPYAPLTGRKVLVPIDAVERTRSGDIGVRMMRAEVARGPGLDSAMPVARLYEEATVGYYAGAADPSETEDAAKRSHLRTSREVIGYSVHGPDGLIGHLADFELEEKGWRITGLVIDARRGDPERRLPPSSVRAIDWKTREVRIAGEAAHEAEELVYWAKKLNVTPEELRSAVQRGGKTIREVVEQLRRKG